jgi:hypothetical protein
MIAYKIYADCVEKVFIKRVFCIPEQQTGFTNAAVTDEQHLEQEVTESTYNHNLKCAYYSCV